MSNYNNNATQIFIDENRVRLFTERNHYKWKADEAQLALHYEKKRNRIVLAFLMVLIVVLLGALLYVLYS